MTVAYRSASTIEQCLRPLSGSGVAALVVVDNDSPDDTVAVVEALALPEVEVIRQANVGFGAGCNTGWLALRHRVELVLFLNPDATIDPPDLARLVDWLDAHPDCGLVAPLMTRGGAPAWTCGRPPTVLTETRPLLPAPLGALLPQRRTDPARTVSGPAGYVEGACMLARVEALAQVGGFDETYFLCFEEIDLAQRLRAAGWGVAVETAARAEHAGMVSRGQESYAGVEHQVRSLRHYLQTWRGPRRAALHAALSRASWSVRRRTGRISPGEEQARLLGLRTPLTRVVGRRTGPG